MTTRVDLHPVVNSHNYTYLVKFEGEYFYRPYRHGLPDTTNFYLECPRTAKISPDFHIDRLLYYMDNDKSKMVAFKAATEEFQPTLDKNSNNFVGHRTIFMTLEEPNFCQRINVWLERAVGVLCVQPEYAIVNGPTQHIYALCGFSTTNLFAEF